MLIFCILLLLLTALPSWAQEPSECVTHHVQVLGGAGYGALGYKSNAQWDVHGQWAGNMQLRYLCQLSPHWGVGVGIGGSYFASTTVQNQVVYTLPNQFTKPIIDSESETYVAHYRTHDWTVAQHTWMVDVPIVGQYAYAFENTTLGGQPLQLWVNGGINLGWNIAAQSQVIGGSLDHLGYYGIWNLELEHIPNHDFYTESAQVYGMDIQPLTLRQPAVGLIADVCLALPVAPTIHILVGAYVHYTVNDISYYTDYTPAMRPMQIGLRLGIDFHTLNQ